MSAEALQKALAAEHAAIFGYGVVGAWLSGEQLQAARDADAQHRNRRDDAMLRIQTAGGQPVAAEPAYALPFQVGDAAGAMRLAAAVEEGAAGAWREAVGATDDDDRQFALDALIACAVMATRWRKLAQVSPVTVPFPGGV
jgi:hypothetical protein